jgi:DNA-directed RNA polymerase subunit alpha
VDHEFSTIAGVEDVTEIILNLNKYVSNVKLIDNESVTISVSGKDQLTAGDFQKFISGFQVLNPELVICNLDSKIKLNFRFNYRKGRGYVPAEEKKQNAAIGTILQIQFYPVKM